MVSIDVIHFGKVGASCDLKRQMQLLADTFTEILKIKEVRFYIAIQQK